MISRIDNENLYYMESDDILAWDRAEIDPGTQIRLAGHSARQLRLADRNRRRLAAHDAWSRTDAASIASATTLLDRDDLRRVIAQTREPLLVPNDEERSGYVPNVVYSCGAMVHNGMLMVPYAMSDLATSIARIDLAELLASMEKS